MKTPTKPWYDTGVIDAYVAQQQTNADALSALYANQDLVIGDIDTPIDIPITIPTLFLTNGDDQDVVLEEQNTDLKIVTGSGWDSITVSGTGNLDIRTGKGESTISTDSGNDKIHTGSDNDNIYTGTGNDYVYAGAGDDNIVTSGTATIYAGDGDDCVSVDGSDTIVYGGNGDDTIDTYDGSDILYGGAGDDGLYAGIGDDFLYGGAGDDVLDGFDGNDLIFGGAGNDSLYGGDGSDTFILDANCGNDWILDFDVKDVIDLNDNGYTLSISDVDSNEFTIDWLNGNGDSVNQVVVLTTGVNTLQYADGFLSAIS